METNTLNRTAYFVLFLTIMISSCTEKTSSDRGFDFVPRKCSEAFLLQMKKQAVIDTKGDTIRHEFLAVLTEGVSINDFVITIETFDSVLDAPLALLEEEIESSYMQMLKTELKSGDAAGEDNDAPPRIIEYRTTGIKQITISSPDVSLFGEPIGNPLNEHLEILHDEPDFIASAESKSLLFGYTDQDKPTTLSGLLSLNPLAPARLYLQFKSPIAGLPVTTVFKVVIETVEGEFITAVSEPVTIIR